MNWLKIKLKLFYYECMLIDALHLAKISGDDSYDLCIRFAQFKISMYTKKASV